MPSLRDGEAAGPMPLVRSPRLAHLVADLHLGEPADRRVAEQLADGLLLVFHERLLEEADLLEEAVEPSLDDLRDCLLGLSFVASAALEDRPLGLDAVGGNVVAAPELRTRGGDVQSD